LQKQKVGEIAESSRSGSCTLEITTGNKKKTSTASATATAIATATISATASATATFK